MDELFLTFEVPSAPFADASDFYLFDDFPLQVVYTVR